MKKMKGFSIVLLALIALSLVFASCKGDDDYGTTTYTVTFNANGGSGTVPSYQTANSGSSITLPYGSGLTKSGYYFGGWNTNSSGTGSNYSAGESFTVTGNITLYARWDASGTGPSSGLVEMVFVAGGSFEMGKNGDGSSGNVTPVHTVTLTGFYMGKYEVTQAQYQTVTGNNPSQFTGNDLPVEYVTWYDAVEFCNKLSEMEGYQPVYTISGRTPATGYPITSATVTANWGSNGYRLPTEAEWEYAARGGNGSPGNYIYSGSNNVDNVAWYGSNSGYTTHAVGTKAPNGLGIYDMSGNVWEWCWDRFGNYPAEAQNNPTGASSGSNRVLRGGSWHYVAQNVRSAYRYTSGGTPSVRGDDRGFRLLRPQF